MCMKRHEPLLPLRPVSLGSLRLYTPSVPHRMWKGDLRVPTHQQKQQRQWKPHGSINLAIPFRKPDSTNSELMLFLHPNHFHLPAPPPPPSSFLKWASFVQSNNRQRRRAEQSKEVLRQEWPGRGLRGFMEVSSVPSGWWTELSSEAISLSEQASPLI